MTSFPLQGGFTVASGQPVNVLGDYNATGGGSQNAWPSAHTESAIIADAVTLLSNNRNDDNNLFNPNNPRSAAETHYRVAIAAGKNVTFNQPAGTAKDYVPTVECTTSCDTLRIGATCSSHDRGAMVKLLFLARHRGVQVSKRVSPVARLHLQRGFTNPANMPPGTPHLVDITNLAYHQDFSPR